MRSGVEVGIDEDVELLRQAQDEPAGEAFRALYERHAPSVLAFLVGLTGDRALADDLLQESFFRVHQHLDRFDPTRPFRPWLLQIARNGALNALRSRKKAVADGAERAASDRVPSQAATAEARAVTRAALDAIDDDERALLLQRHGLGLSLEAMAGSWGCTDRTIRNRLHAAADSLLRALLAQGGRP